MLAGQVGTGFRRIDMMLQVFCKRMQTMRTKGFSHGHVPVTALEMQGKGKRSYAFSEDFEDKSV